MDIALEYFVNNSKVDIEELLENFEPEHIISGKIHSVGEVSFKKGVLVIVEDLMFAYRYTLNLNSIKDKSTIRESVKFLKYLLKTKTDCTGIIQLHYKSVKDILDKDKISKPKRIHFTYLFSRVAE